FTWDYLYELATRKDQLWADYLAELASAGKSRAPPCSGNQASLR
ncbi:hypothetical protein ACQKEQ_29530, partial [Pseudomonas aeruginosa]